MTAAVPPTTPPAFSRVSPGLLEMLLVFASAGSLSQLLTVLTTLSPASLTSPPLSPSGEGRQHLHQPAEGEDLRGSPRRNAARTAEDGPTLPGQGAPGREGPPGGRWCRRSPGRKPNWQLPEAEVAKGELADLMISFK